MRRWERVRLNRWQEHSWPGNGMLQTDCLSLSMNDMSVKVRNVMLILSKTHSASFLPFWRAINDNQWRVYAPLWQSIFTSSIVQYVSRPSRTRSTLGCDNTPSPTVNVVLKAHSASPIPMINHRSIQIRYGSLWACLKRHWHCTSHSWRPTNFRHHRASETRIRMGR